MDEEIIWIREEGEQNTNFTDQQNSQSSRSDFNFHLQNGIQTNLSISQQQSFQNDLCDNTTNYSNHLINQQNKEDEIPKKSNEVQSICNKVNATAESNENIDNDLLLSTAEEFDISEYERKLRENTEETMNLVMNLCDRSDKLKEQQKSTLLRLEEEQIERKKTMEKMEKIAEINKQLFEEKTELQKEVITLKEFAGETKKDYNVGGRIEWHNVDSARFGDCFLTEPTSALILPNFNIFISDNNAGLFLFSIHSEFIRKVTNLNWKWPQAAAIYENNKILVSMMIKSEEDATTWKRFLVKFDENLNYIAKIEGPKWIEEETISRERLCVASTGFIYMAVSSQTFTALYELSPEGRWTELYYKKGQCFTDIQVLAVIGPITELFVVEEHRRYLWMLSIRESAICARKLLAVVEKPGAICVDDVGQFFIHDIGQGKIRQIDTKDNFEVISDIALADKSLYAISANKGFLAIIYREKNIIRLNKYKSIK